jgi:hypothetical protein
MIMLTRTIAFLCASLAVSTLTAATTTTTVISLDGANWRLATDAKNVGVAEKWWESPRAEAKQVKVPWTIQMDFPNYAGYAWYWRDVDAPVNPDKEGRYLLRFWNVDYLADVWVNGTHIGRHEGAQACFTLDATVAIQPGVKNRIAVRVLSLHGTIDGYTRSQTPHGGYRDFNLGGIFDSVDLIVTPRVRTDDLFVRADWKTGKVRVDATFRNATKSALRGRIEFSVAPAVGGEPLAAVMLDREIQPGASTIQAELQVPNHRLWDLNDPQLYRVIARVAIPGTGSVDENSTRFGFRDFRFENGYFRLNGRRVFWRSAHAGGDTPITICIPYDRDLVRRDLVNLKAMGFNGIRFISIMGHRCQLDLCDELGLMVYEESHASWLVDPSDEIGKRMDASFTGMLMRDRNHPSVVMWGLLNETGDGKVFRHAVASLPLMRRLDDTRVILLGSGRFDATNFLDGLEVWQPAARPAPALTYNPKDYAISGVTLWRPREVALIPGFDGERSIARWTAPSDGEYTVAAKFRGCGTFTVTDIHVLLDNKPLYNGFINQQGRGDVAEWQMTRRLSRGQTLDFAVGGATPRGGEWYLRWGNSTSLSVNIKSANGKSFDLAADFSNSKNPNGPWSFGSLPALPNDSTFSPYAKCETVNNTCPGDVCNPGSDHWEDVLGDQHYYPRVPHRELEIARLRNIAINDNPMFLSEYGIGSGVDLPRCIRHYEQLGAESAERLPLVKNMYAAFMADWERLKLADAFASPEDFFAKSLAREAGLKTMGINAIRSNPRMVGYGMTGCNDPVEFGEGLFTAFRELKPGTVDAVFDAFYPVRWCTFAEPVSVYRGAKVRLEAVLANEDTAPAGDYPVRLMIVGPNNERIMDKTITVTVPDRTGGKEPPFAASMFAEDVPVDGPTGKYRFLVTFQKGVAAAGGEAVFYVTDPADMPSVDTEVVLWGDDPELAAWLKGHGVKTRPYEPGPSKAREVILASNSPRAGGTPEAWRDLAARISQGSTAVFPVPAVFRKGDAPLGWLPMVNKGRLDLVCEYNFPQVYPKDEWCKRHPLFDGLPSGGLMDHTFYREIIPDLNYLGQDTPAEAVSGSIRTSNPVAYWCDVMLSVYDFGAGRFILNGLRVREELGRDPTAERLLRNMLRYAAREAGTSTAKLPSDFDGLLKSIGYE